MTITSKYNLRYQWAVLVLVFFAFTMSTFLSRGVFEHLPHLEDEVAYLYQAKIFARGDIVIETPQPRRAYWQPFVIDHDGLRFSKYTPGWSGLLSVGILLGQTWVINAFFAALTVALVYQLGHDLFNRDVGLIAAGLTAFSPMALLLNASLMGHSAALFFTTLFIFAYRQIEKRQSLQWGVVAGIALGCVVVLRPLTAVGIGFPFIAWSVVQVVHSLITGNRLKTLAPLALLSVCTLGIGSFIPLYNDAATGDPPRNLYTFVWEYDQLGFGECCGRNGHTLERAILHTRYDLSLTAADVFGWQIGDVDSVVENHWLLESDYFPNIGLSFVLLPFGIMVGFFGMPGIPRRRTGMILLGVWLVGCMMLFSGALTSPIEQLRNSNYAWSWIIGATLWLMMPLVFLRGRDRWQARWTWLLLCVALGLVLAQMTYWIGSQRYSTRYYFEGLSAFAIVSALPLAYVARLRGRLIIYVLVGMVLLYGLVTYSLPRVGVLYRFNMINPTLLDEINLRREDDRPLLVLISGSASGDNRIRWRALGTLMTVTSPYRDSEIVGAWYYDDLQAREQILADYPERQVIEMRAAGNDIWFVDNTEDSG